MPVFYASFSCFMPFSTRKSFKRSLKDLEDSGLILQVRRNVREPNRIYTLLPQKEADVMNEKLEKLNRKLAKGKARLGRAQQEEKIQILSRLLSNYNDGRRKNFFCVAVNLLELSELQRSYKSNTI